MGYAFCLAPCFVCGVPFTCNPRKVPSYQNQPICESCIRIVNAKRREKGLPEWPVLDDAYEPCEESEL